MKEQLNEVKNDLRNGAADNIVAALTRVRQELLTVQPRGNESKAKSRLVTSVDPWLETLRTLKSSSHWPSTCSKQLKIVQNMLTGMGQGAQDEEVPFDLLQADCKKAAQLLQDIIGKVPAALAPKPRKLGTEEEDPYDYSVGEGSDIIGDFDVSAMERHASLVSRMPGVNNVQNAPASVILSIPLIVTFGSYRTMDVFQAQGFDVSDIGGHLCFEEQRVLAVNTSLFDGSDTLSEYIESQLRNQGRSQYALAYENPFYYDNHIWRLYWLLPTNILSQWLRHSTIPTRVGVAFANREKPVNPNFLKNLKRKEDRRLART